MQMSLCNQFISAKSLSILNENKAMLKNLFQNAWLKKVAYAVSVGMLSLATTHSVYAAPAQSPLFLTAPVTPLMMLNMSRDHQLYFKVYDDYADITDPLGGAPDGIPDITYNNNYDYYGYFDSAKCYSYSTSNGRFEPVAWRATGTRACNNQWSGNFLNWATMTRIDVIRKILYGGYRSTDNAAATGGNSVTVLERTFLPNDTHSFAKFYKPSSETELKKVVPSAVASENGITLCNTTDPANRTKPSSGTSLALSQNVVEPPLIKVAKGNYSLWANNERWQCGWKGVATVGSALNGNFKSVSGIDAESENPNKGTDGTGFGNYIARVQVCASGFIANPKDDNENCRSYSTGNVKPIGLLQEFGESDSIHFGLITGSYSKNKSGGVLRKAVGSIKNEINLTTGVFQPINTATNGIIDTLNKLRIFGYNYAEGLYNVSHRLCME
jgi:type IV pilus assembly protein PilY1